MAAGVVYALADADGVGPDELLGVVEPARLELLLADRADAVRQHRVVGHRDVLQLGGLPLRRRGAAPRPPGGRLAVLAFPRHVVFVDGLPALDPVLDNRGGFVSAEYLAIFVS